MVYSLILRLVRNTLDAEELYQDVFLKVFRHIGSYKPEVAALDVWLRRIAYNSSLNHLRHLRRNRKEIALGDEALAGLTDVPTADADDEETIELMARALEQLPPTDRTLIMMFYYDGMAFSEIAYVTGSTTSSIGSRLYRIRKKLYNLIRELKNP